MSSKLDILKFLGILAVTVAVVAGVINVLFQHSNAANISPMLKKTVSTINQSVMMAKAHNDTDFAAAVDFCAEDIKEAKIETLSNHQSFCAIFNDTLKNSLFWGKVSDVKYYVGGKVLHYVLYDRDIIPDDYRDYYAYTLKDGTMIAFDPDAIECSIDTNEKQKLKYVLFSFKAKSHLKHCVGFVDVNGYLPPNKEVICAHGSNDIMSDGSDCVVNMRGNKLGDVYPVAFYNSSVEPASSAAKFVINHKK